MKKSVIVGSVAGLILLGIVISYTVTQFESESLNLDMGRQHGTVSTAMASPILGSTSAPVTIIEFGDYQCHQCKNWFHNTKPLLNENYIETGKVNLIFVDLQFLGRDSPIAGQATYCAEEQGEYWNYHNLLYLNQENIDNGWANSERLKAFAFSLGLDIEMFDNCLDSRKYDKRIKYNMNEAEKHDATGTPTFIILNSDGAQQKIVGAQPYVVFKNIIDSMI